MRKFVSQLASIILFEVREYIASLLRDVNFGVNRHVSIFDTELDAKNRERDRKRAKFVALRTVSPWKGISVF
jgi:hypothetical protein